MSKNSSNPNIVGGIKQVKERTASGWRYRTEKFDDWEYDSPDNAYSDNDGHQTSFPIPAPTRRR